MTKTYAKILAGGCALSSLWIAYFVWELFNPHWQIIALSLAIIWAVIGLVYKDLRK